MNPSRPTASAMLELVRSPERRQPNGLMVNALMWSAMLASSCSEQSGHDESWADASNPYDHCQDAANGSSAGDKLSWAEPPCYDWDCDGFFTGLDCPPGTLLDCRDEDAAVNPDAIEVCNSRDDDCNDLIDDGAATPPCPLQNGVCAGSRARCGSSSCRRVQYGSDYEEEETRCDGLDNDCDGSADEGC